MIAGSAISLPISDHVPLEIYTKSSPFAGTANTADAVSSVFELVKYANTTATNQSSKEYVDGLLAVIVKLTDVLGLIVEKEEELLAEDIEKLIEERQAARKAKNFQRADEIRNELLEKGIILEDTREGVKWRKA